ncbi:MAG: YciI family protein [Bacteroidales bacterium]
MKKIFFVAIFLYLGMSVLAQQPETLFFVMLNTNPDREELPKKQVDSLQQGHLENISRLAEEGYMKAAGPFHGGGGLFIMSAKTKQEVAQLLQSDPAISANRFRVDVSPLKLSVGSVCPVGEEYEMAEYLFISYKPVANAEDLPEGKKLERLNKRHYSYVYQHIIDRRIIAAGTFLPRRGGLIVMHKANEEELEKFLKYDPWIKNGLYTWESRILWIARGSFCEKQ